MKATFSIDENKQYVIDVNFTWYGIEQYFLNGELIKKQFSLSPGGKREFNIDNNKIEFFVSSKKDKPICSVYKNKKLFIEELFPELKQKFLDRKKKGFNKKRFIRNVILWFVLAFCSMLFFRYLNLK